jgi:hypothetical protein
MPLSKIILTLHPFGSEEAARVADDIRNKGEVSYVDNSGSTVNVTVGDVTVENDNT